MSYQIYYNGIYLEESKALIPVADRAFLVGEGLFETLRAYQGHLVFLENHLERMQEAANLLGLHFPISLARLKFLAYETLHLNRLTDAVIRIYLTPEGTSIGDLDSPPQKMNLLISCQPFTPFPSLFYEKGVPCLIVKGIFSEMGLLAQLKSTSYLSRVLARRQARTQGAFEGLLVNALGQITEGSGSNIFIVHQEKIFTPPLHSGLLAGVTRNQIFKISQKENISLEEKILLPQDLFEADEIFMTSTLKEVMPVASVDGKHSQQKTPGALTQKLMQAYRDEIQWQTERFLSEATGLAELP